MSNFIPLRNDNYVFILGAGYSAARGYPLISNFMNRMRDAAIWCEAKERMSEAKAIHDVLRFRLDAAAAAYRVPIELENVEELFSLASASSRAIVDGMKVSIAATLAYCNSSFPEPHIRFSVQDIGLADLVAHAKQDGGDHLTRVMPLYDAVALKLLLCLESQRSSVITFNYDDLVERAVSRVGGSFHLGLSKKPRLEDGVPYDESGLAIFKLHGSVTWSNSDGKFCVHKDYESLRRNELVPEIIPPTWNKSIANQLSEVWFSAIKSLSTATKIFIIGFSMPKTDMHFKYLLAAGMKDNVSLREIVFVDPSPQIMTRVKELLDQREMEGGRVRHVQTTVQGLIGTRIDQVPGRYITDSILSIPERVFGDS